MRKEGERLRERYQGQSLDRLEDVRFLTGRGKYVANDRVPGVLHAYVLRSPVAFARIARLGLEAARAVPGVVAVFTEADLAADGIGELPCVTVIDAVEPIVVPPRPALARGVVRHVGDPVACIVAESLEAAIAAGEAMEISYDAAARRDRRRRGAEAGCAADLAGGAGQLRLPVPEGRRGGRRGGDGVGGAMSSNATSSTTASLPRRWRRAPRSATYDRRTDRFLLSLTGQARARHPPSSSRTPSSAFRSSACAWSCPMSAAASA